MMIEQRLVDLGIERMKVMTEIQEIDNNLDTIACYKSLHKSVDIELSNLIEKRFKLKQALKQINFEINVFEKWGKE